MTEINVELVELSPIIVEFPPGVPGPPGVGVPPGGTTNQVLAKESNADYDTHWVSGGGGGGAVDSVNGQTGIVVLDAADVDADPDGSAAQALIDANNYTDTEIGLLAYVESVVAGNNIVVDNTDPQNPIVSAQGSTSYIYNPDLTQQGSVYNDWQDLVDAINATGNAPSVINFTKIGSQTLPAGHYNLNNVIWRGTGSAPGGGALINIPNGFTLHPMPYWTIEFGLAIYHNSSAPIFTTNQSFRLTLDSAAFGAVSSEAILIDSPASTVNIIFVANGGSLTGSLGYEPIRVANTNFLIVPIVISGVNPELSANAIRGGTNALLIRLINTIQYTGDPFVTQANWTGTIVLNRGVPTLIGYDGTVSGLTANNIQAAIDELAASTPTPILPTSAPFFTPSGEHFLLSSSIGTGYAAVSPSSSTTNSNNVGRMLPFAIYEATSIDALALHCQAANNGAGAVLRLGIYADNSGRPGNVIVDAGTESINATGLKTLSFTPIVLQPGRYWAIAATQNLNTAGVNPAFSSTSASTTAFPETTPQASNNMFAVAVGQQPSSLTDDPFFTLTRSTNAGVPNIWARKT